MRSDGISVSKVQRRTGLLAPLARAALRLRVFHMLAEFLIAARFTVRGDSMQPNFAADQYILVSRVAYMWDEPSRGDVVVLRHPFHLGRHYIKRVVGLPGERMAVARGRVHINGRLLEEPYLSKGIGHGDARQRGAEVTVGNAGQADADWLLGEEEYYVMGDNRANSDDSRSLGPMKRQLIVGKAWLRYWPREAWGLVR